VRTQPRFVDLDKCTSCGECEKVCPVVLPDEFDEGLGTRKAAYKKYAQAIPGVFAIQKADRAPCRLSCPAGLNVQGYVQMVKEGKYERALEIIMDDLPLPGVLGRICPHECEDACRRCEVDEPVSICRLKRLAADQFDPRKVKIDCMDERPEKVAIVGSGPAGLSAAYHLARQGIKSTIYESLPKAGGMLRVGIPNHRLPEAVLDQEIEVITNLGVEIKTSTPLGPDLTVNDLLKDHKAVYLAVGAHKGYDLAVEGDDADGVRQGVDFLREVNLTGKTQVGKKVLIIGGGNVAIDVSRAAVRLGAESVQIVYRRTRTEMPAWEEEIEAAEAEDVRIEYLAAPQEILVEGGKVKGMRCIRMELGEPDSSGRRRPVPMPGSEFDLEADQVVAAIGQQPDFSAFADDKEVEYTRRGTLEADLVTYATSREGVFAGGDAHTGPWNAIGAVAAGREAAVSITRYIDGKDMADGRVPISNDDPVFRPVPKDMRSAARATMPELEPASRRATFDEVELGFEPEAGQTEADRCLNCSYCSDCMECVTACAPGAIDHSMVEVERDIEVGAVILSAGIEPFDPSGMEDTYHHGSNPNVMTSLEFERILSASGPTEGHLSRPSDHQEPKKIAWLQCVGSRDTNRCGNGYCSSVCCMYAVKDAMMAKEHAEGELDCVIFNMDMRTFGKEYEKYLTRGEEQSGVRFVKARVHTIDEMHDTGDLRLRYFTEDGKVVDEQFDMVVLSVGLQVSDEAVALAEKLGVELNENRFVKQDSLTPLSTSRPGVFACGAFNGPKDIPDSVAQSSAAACIAGAGLAPARSTLTRTLELPPEVDVTDDEPRVGVFVCNCGVNIGGFADVPAIVDYAKELDGVVYAEENMFSCSQDTQEQITKTIQEQKLNRVVVAACTPRTHEPLFQFTLQNAGLNPHLFEMANIRNQCTWVHSTNKELATAKSKDLVKMGVARARELESIQPISVAVDKAALVIGGGVAGMTAALGLADQGFPTTLVEKSPDLGGRAKDVLRTHDGRDVPSFLTSLIERAQGHKNLTVMTDAQVLGASGYVGNFETEVKNGNGPQTIHHGAVVVATGGQPTDTEEYLYGQHPAVTRWHDLEKDPSKLAKADTVTFIQCVGSRNDPRPYCSRICCSTTVSMAIEIKQKKPDTNVFVLYRDMRTFGEREALYRQARELGVIFIRYALDRKPEVVAAGDALIVKVFDPILGAPVEIETDLLNLATAIEPNRAQDIASFYKLPLTEDQFFMEAHAKLRPVDFASDGLFMAGLAHYPKALDESVAQAMAAASRAVTVLSKDRIQISPYVSAVDVDKCIGCGLCEEVCAFGAIHLEEVDGIKRAKNIQASCKGCGICAASCPQQAIDMLHFRFHQIEATVRAVV
jgi:heterodisulfide reductase subunit A2